MNDRAVRNLIEQRQSEAAQLESTLTALTGRTAEEAQRAGELEAQVAAGQAELAAVLGETRAIEEEFERLVAIAARNTTPLIESGGHPLVASGVGIIKPRHLWLGGALVVAMIVSIILGRFFPL